MLLALDTSTSVASLAVYDGRVVAESTWWSGRRHTEQMMPAVRSLLGKVGRQVGDVRAVAVARGPGSFTGVRAGIALARGLAFGLDVPIFGVCSLDVLAAAVQGVDLPVRPLLDAGRGRFATSRYCWENGRLRRLEEIRGTDLAGLLGLLREKTVLTGDLTDEARAELARNLGPLVVLTTPAASLRRAGFLAELAWQRFLAGERPGLEDSEPIYI